MDGFLKEDSEAAHICSPGPYRESVKQLLKKNPNLRFNDLIEYEISARSVIQPQAKVVALQLDLGKDAIRKDLADATALRLHLQQQGSLIESSQRRSILLIEGYHPEYIDIIGEHFGIDPQFFSTHRRTAVWESWHRSGNTPSLASARNDENSFILEFWELWFLRENFGTASSRCADGHRTIYACRVPGRNFDRVVR